MGVLVSHLFRQEAVHDEDQRSLQAVEDSEDICNHYGAFFKQEGPKHPHQTQYAHLGDSCHCESSAEIKGGCRVGVQRKGQKIENERKD